MSQLLLPKSSVNTRLGFHRRYRDRQGSSSAYFQEECEQEWSTNAALNTACLIRVASSLLLHLYLPVPSSGSCGGVVGGADIKLGWFIMGSAE